MFEESLDSSRWPAPDVSLGEQGKHLTELRALIVGRTAVCDELPALPDLAAGVIALAEGSRRKVMLPLGRAPLEFTLSRRGHYVLVDCYGTESTPEIVIRERKISLRALLDACSGASRILSEAASHSTTGTAFAQLAARIDATRIEAMLDQGDDLRACTGGSLESPGAHVPLAFGFRARMPRAQTDREDHHAFADVHALLFEGELWAFSSERRVPLVRGPIMLATIRMVSAMRALVDAWRSDRALHVRLCAGGFTVGVRRELSGEVALSLSTEKHGTLTWPALDVPTAALPVLRLASDSIRKLVAVDRTQVHNLRVTSLRAEIRALRTAIRSGAPRDGFENENPDRLRLSSPEERPVIDAREAAVPVRGRLRYTERWSAEIDSLDAGSIFLSGERLIVATPKLTLALDRSDGSVRWSLPSERATTWLAGQSLVRLLPGGGAELCDPDDGHVYARTDTSLRLHGSSFALCAGGGEVPPVVVLCEAGKRVVALDLRTGEPRFRFRARGNAAVRVKRVGRVLLVTSGDGSLDALDAASGEVVWRFADRGRFCLSPAVFGEHVLVASGEPGGGTGTLYCLELYTGKLRWKAELPHAPSGEPITTAEHVLLPTGGSRDARISAFTVEDGRVCWTCHDPGLDNGGRAIEVDGQLIVNTPSGRLHSIDLATGQTRFTRSLANPLTDDVPRQLDPVLRHGALFVPSAQVHVLRPSDGTTLTTDVGCDLVPDFLRIDERGYFYVAEESGHLRAYAAAPQLSLVR